MEVFLGTTALLPPLLRGVKVDFEYGHRFDFESKRVSFSFTQELQAVGPESLLELGFEYLDGDGNLRWDIGDVRVQSDTDDNGHWINIQRNIAPSKDLDDTWQSAWDKLVHRKHPWDGISRTENDVTKITTIVDRAESSAPFILYSAFVGAAGNIPQDEMKAKLDLLLHSLRVNEP